MSYSVRPHRQQPTRLLRPWDSPGKNTGVGCHFLLQCMKAKSESEVAQLCPTPSDPKDWSPPGSSVLGIFQARVLEWGCHCLLHQYSFYSLTNSFTEWLGASMCQALCWALSNLVFNGRLPRWHRGKDLACQCRRWGLDPTVWKIPWRRKWQPTPVLLTGKISWTNSLVGYSPWGHKKSDTIEHTGTVTRYWYLWLVWEKITFSNTFWQCFIFFVNLCTILCDRLHRKLPSYVIPIRCFIILEWSSISSQNTNSFCNNP